MKYFIYVLLTLTLFSCNKESIRKSTTGSKDSGSAKTNGTINPKFFELINLNYPGLEKAKILYESDKPYEATKAILEY